MISAGTNLGVVGKAYVFKWDSPLPTPLTRISSKCNIWADNTLHWSTMTLRQRTEPACASGFFLYEEDGNSYFILSIYIARSLELWLSYFPHEPPSDPLLEISFTGVSTSNLTNMRPMMYWDHYPSSRLFLYLRFLVTPLCIHLLSIAWCLRFKLSGEMVHFAVLYLCSAQP